MKKQYIQPKMHVVIVKLMGSVLETEGVGIAGSLTRAGDLGARGADNRYWDDEEEYAEVNIWK